MNKSFKLHKDNLAKEIQALKGLLPSDPYRELKDFHTTNAMGFYGEGIIKRTFDKRDQSIELKEVYQKGDLVPESDLGKKFDNGFIAVRKYFRNNSKAPGLALLYGGTPKVLEDHFKVARALSIRMWSNFFKILPVLKKRLDERLEKAKVNGYVETLFGRRLYLPQLKDKRTYHIGVNKVYNSPIQSTSSDLIKIAILKSSNWIEKYQLNRYTINATAKSVKGELYSRIVSISRDNIKNIDELEKDLKALKKGHTKVIIVKGKKVIKEFSYNVKLDYYTFKKYRMELVH